MSILRSNSTADITIVAPWQWHFERSTMAGKEKEKRDVELPRRRPNDRLH
jgi:hypothetical protein